MAIKSKTENFEKVRLIVKDLENPTFTNTDIVKLTNLNYEQVKRILIGLEELGEVKHIESNNIYVRLD